MAAPTGFTEFRIDSPGRAQSWAVTHRVSHCGDRAGCRRASTCRFREGALTAPWGASQENRGLKGDFPSVGPFVMSAGEEEGSVWILQLLAAFCLTLWVTCWYVVGKVCLLTFWPVLHGSLEPTYRCTPVVCVFPGFYKELHITKKSSAEEGHLHIGGVFSAKYGAKHSASNMSTFKRCADDSLGQKWSGITGANGSPKKSCDQVQTVLWGCIHHLKVLVGALMMSSGLLCSVCMFSGIFRPQPRDSMLG